MLTDVARIVNGVENDRQAAWMDRQPAVILNVQRQPGANTIAVVDRIKQVLPRLRVSLPAGIDVAILTDVVWSDTTCPDGTNSGADGGTCDHNLGSGAP